MLVTERKCYCDVASEHDGNPPATANTYKLYVTTLNADGTRGPVVEREIDLCPACRAKYNINLRMGYNFLGKPVFAFEEEE